MSTIFFLALRRPPVKAGELVQFGRLNNVFKKWMWGVRNDTICWFFWMLSKLSGWPHDIFLIWIPYLGRGGAIQCRLCGTWGGIAAISAKEASKGPLGFDSWQPPLNVVMCHIELKCFEPDSMFEWIIELQWKTVKFTQNNNSENQDEAKIFNLVAAGSPLWTELPSPWRRHSSALTTWWMNNAEAQKLGGQAGIPEDIGPLFDMSCCQKLLFTSREGEKEIGGEEEDQRGEQPALENPNQSLHLLLLQRFLTYLMSLLLHSSLYILRKRQKRIFF